MINELLPICKGSSVNSVMLRVSNIAHLLTKLDQVAKAGRLERKHQNNQASSLQLRQNQRENKIKKSKLAY